MSDTEADVDTRRHEAKLARCKSIQDVVDADFRFDQFAHVGGLATIFRCIVVI